MPPETQATPEVSAETLAGLLKLSRRARQAANISVLGFLAVNDTHELAPYRQAALWSADHGIQAVSGVVQLEANASYAQWLNRICQHVSSDSAQPQLIDAQQLPEKLAAEWNTWLPGFGLWLPLTKHDESNQLAMPWGGLLLARDTPWQEQEITALAEWMDVWCHARQAHLEVSSWFRWGDWQGHSQRQWWKRRRLYGAIGLIALLLIPVRLTVLAPGELVPTNPTVIRAPLEGVVGNFLVKPNEAVKAGQALFNFDDAPLKSRLEVARQALASAEAEYRQAAQLAVSETKYKGQLALLTGKVEERRAEADYLQGQLERAHVVAPHEGIALFDDPSEWIGRPVSTGERIMRIAAPDDVEIEAWLAVGDAIPLQSGAPVSLYLNASPLFSVSAQVRYVAFDAVQRPDGSYAYRVRASLDSKTEHRVGLKGTAKLSGRWVPLAYWVGRRPLAAVRQMVSW
jgi:multidrug resistance efflux pump